MKIKLGFLDEYIGGKKDRDSKQLIPTRKPSVRLNLKGVKINRHKKVEQPVNKEAENLPLSENINTISKEVIFEKPRESKESLKKNFKFPDNFNFFTKAKMEGFGRNKYDDKLDEGYLRRQVSKKSNKYGLWFLIFSVFLLILVSIYVFYTTIVNATNEELENCKNTVASALTKGIRTDDLNCGGFSVFDISQSNTERYTEIDEKITLREKESKSQIEELDKEILEKSDLLSIFGVDVEAQEFDDKNYLTVISKKQEEIAGLESQLNEKKTTIVEFEKNYKYLLGLAGDAPVVDEEKFYQEYIELTDDEKFENFPLFKENFGALQDKLKFQTPGDNKYTASAFSDPEFFNFKIFTSDEFINIFDEKKLANTAETLDRLSLTGNVNADNKIYDIAESRGYKIRVSAIESKLVGQGELRLQKEVLDSFNQMKKAAELDGIKIDFVSGYRSIEDQKGIFTQRFASQSGADNGSEYSPEDIISGKADGSIDKVLTQSSVPGYSKHHSGYTVDINEVDGAGGLTAFGETEAFKWISANNYFNAKKFGFVPSYPSGSKKVGPEPEPWEYVWVGVDLLKN